MPAAAPLLALLLSALPPAPEKVVLETRSFGTVTVDHAAHLKRRARCVSCHGPGPITKVGRLEPKDAHERCIGCHKKEARGPTGCRQCHVVPDPAAAKPTLAGGPVPGAPGEGSAPGSGAAPVLARATGAGPPPAVLPGGPVGQQPAFAPEPFEETPRAILVEVGGTTAASSHRPAVLGLAARVTLREDRLRIRQSLEWYGGQRGRTLGLLGAGWSFPLDRRWNLETLALAGFDAVSGQPVNVLPAAGLQVGVSWAARLGFVDELAFSLTGLSDLVRRRELLGEPVGGTALSATLTMGFTRGAGR